LRSIEYNINFCSKICFGLFWEKTAVQPSMIFKFEHIRSKFEIGKEVFDAARKRVTWTL